MDRRRFFSVLPLSLLGLPTALKAEPENPAEESPWVEITCQWQGTQKWQGPQGIPPCATVFKAVRGAHPVCPKCGTMQDTSGEELRKLFVGIEVKK